MTDITTTTTHNNAASSVRGDVVYDLWNTVNEMRQMCNFTISSEMVMKDLMQKTMNSEGEFLNDRSDYTFGRVRLCEWEAFDKELSTQCW